MRDWGVIRNRRGVSLLFIAALMTVFGALIAIVVALLPNLSDETRLDETKQTMSQSKDELLSFAVNNSRFPCPDNNSDGIEDCAVTSTSGDIPYQTMGLPNPVIDEANIPVRYAPYRNAAASADLASVTNVYTPNLATSIFCPSAVAAANINLYDLCTTLTNATTASVVPNPAFVNTGPANANVSYALVSGGLEDADGDNADRSLDGANDDGDLSFADPALGRTPGYDDFVQAASFGEIQRELSCTTAVASMNALASATHDSKLISDDALAQMIMAILQAILDSVIVVHTIVDVVDSIASDAAYVLVDAECVAVAAACVGLCVWIDAACVVIAGVIAYQSAVQIPAAILEVVASIVNAVASIANAAWSLYVYILTTVHLCDILNEAVAADLRGGLR